MKYCKANRYDGNYECENLAIRIQKVHDEDDEKLAILTCIKLKRILKSINYKHLVKDWQHLDNISLPSPIECQNVSHEKKVNIVNGN